MAFTFNRKQRGYTPVVLVRVNGREVAGGFYTRLIKATIRDEAGQTSDSLTLELDDADNAIELPPDKATIEFCGGFRETGGPELLGIYELQTPALKGDESTGESVVLQASAADLKRKLKGEGREHFDSTTLGEIVETIAKRNGMQGRVDPDLAKIKIPYKARVDSSEIDFLTTLGDEFGAVIKPMGPYLVAAPRGKAKSSGGQELPPIEIEKPDCSRWEITPEGRAQYGKVKAAYIDQKSGKRETVESKTGLDGPDFTVRQPLPNKEQAEKASYAEAQRLTRNTGQGFFELAVGRTDAQAEADVIAGASFRDGIAGTWRAEAVEHTFDENGFRTKIEVKAREDGSSGKEKSSGKDE